METISKSSRRGQINNPFCEWLTDGVIDAVNKLILIHIGVNCQSTTVAHVDGGFDQLNCEGIMVLHDSNHWVTTACLGGTVIYLDSAKNRISPVVCRQCASCMLQ